MDYVIKQRINNPHRIPPHIFDEKHIDDYSSIYIASDGRFYGVIDDNNAAIIPFEYDNITVIGFGLLQLVKGGKLGIARVNREFDKDFQPIKVIRIIPCEFDTIVTPWYSEIVILRKDESVGMSVRAYFTDVEELTDWYSDYEILDRDIAELRNSDGSYLFDARNGKMFLHHENKSLISFDAPFKDEDELDFMKVGGRGIVIITYGKKESIIYYNGKRTRQHFYEGEIHPIYKVTDCEHGHRPAVIGFILEEDGDMILLGADCQKKNTDSLFQIKAETRIEAYSKDKNQTVVYPFASETYRSELSLKDFFEECDDLFGSDFEEDEDE